MQKLESLVIVIGILSGACTIIQTFFGKNEFSEKLSRIISKKYSFLVLILSLCLFIYFSPEKNNPATSPPQKTSINENLLASNVNKIEHKEVTIEPYDSMIATTQKITSVMIKDDEFSKLTLFFLDKEDFGYAVKAAKSITSPLSQNYALKQIITFAIQQKNFEYALEAISDISSITLKDEYLKKIVDAATQKRETLNYAKCAADKISSPARQTEAFRVILDAMKNFDSNEKKATSSRENN